MNGVNYDNWLNRHNPYDKDYEREEERAYHLENIKDMVKKRYTTTCSLTESKTQEKKSSNDLFWEAEADIIRQDLLSERDVRRLRTN